MKAVIDTNVFVSALLIASSPPGRILDAWYAGEFDIIVTDSLLTEIRGVLIRPKLLARGAYAITDIENLVRQLRKSGLFRVPRIHHQTIASDPSDNALIDAAVIGRADYIVSGDKHLLRLMDFRGIEIVEPNVFAGILANKASRRSRRKAA
jgi:putative PIN family toxin of toxin-antitoxin system